MKSKLTIIVLVMLSFTFFYINSFATDKEFITEDFEMGAKTSLNNEVQYGISIEINGKKELIMFNASEYNLPSNLFEYRDYIRFRITYTKSDLKIQDCKLVNYEKNEIIEDTSEENIMKLFDISYGKNTIEKKWNDTIKLSTLKENEIYKYTASSTVKPPKIENDTGENCAIYLKEDGDDIFKREINMVKTIDGGAISFSTKEYNSGESLSIIYDKLLTADEVLDIVNEEKVIYLSKINNGEEIEHTFEEFIYNDTNKYANIDVKNVVFEQEINKSYTMGKGEIWGFDWMINTATVTFSDKLEENKNNSDNLSNNTNSNKNVISTNKNNVNSNSQAQQKIPEAGNTLFFINMMFLLLIISIMLYIKYRSFKDIK